MAVTATRRGAIQAGVAVGAVLGSLLGGVWGRAPEPPREVAGAGALLSDCDGRLRELVLHYVPAARQLVATAYRQLLASLPGDVTVRVVVPDRAAFADLREALGGGVACRLEPVVAGHELTPWARDRWLAFAPGAAGGPALLLVPRAEAGAGAWPPRLGDAQVGWDLAAALAPRVATRASSLLFDGGDFVADSRRAFVAPNVERRNPGRPVEGAAGLGRELEVLTGLEVAVLREAPPHHAGMFMMVAGEGRVLVGDPAAARALGPFPVEQPDFGRATQERFDAVARACAELGYRVTRMPVVPGPDGRTYLTPVNAIVDQLPSGRVVYMPVYRGAERLNRAARATWEGLGCRVVPVDCTDTYRHFGSLRCLVGVLRRADPARARGRRGRARAPAARRAGSTNDPSRPRHSSGSGGEGGTPRGDRIGTDRSGR